MSLRLYATYERSRKVLICLILSTTSLVGLTMARLTTLPSYVADYHMLMHQLSNVFLVTGKHVDLPVPGCYAAERTLAPQ